MIVLADNDVVLKIAQCDLFSEFLAAFAVPATQVMILRAARFSMASKNTSLRVGAESANRLAKILATVSDILAPANPDFLAALNEQIGNGIDAGEAILFATCPSLDGSIIVTGDKRSLLTGR